MNICSSKIKHIEFVGNWKSLRILQILLSRKILVLGSACLIKYFILNFDIVQDDKHGMGSLAIDIKRGDPMLIYL